MVYTVEQGANIELVSIVERNIDQCRRFNNMSIATIIDLRFILNSTTSVYGVAKLYHDKVYLESGRTSEYVYLYGRNSL